MIKADGFDEAIIGFTELKSSGLYVIVYDATKIVDILMERDGMSHEEAVEYFEFNVQGAYIGKQTPLYIFPADLEQIEQLSEGLND